MKQLATACCLALLLGGCLLLAPLRACAQVLRGTFATGAAHSLSIHADGSLWATGANTNGQLGTGTTTSSAAWVQVGTATNWVQVAAGQYHSLGLRADGTLWAWGYNNDGQLGNSINTSSNTPTPTPTRVGTGLYTQVAAGLNFSLGLRADGTLWAWGGNTYGQLGNSIGNGVTAANPTPTRVGADLYTQVAAGQYHSLGLRVDGSLYAWGYNQSGQLGNSLTTFSTPTPTPTRVGTGLYTQVAAGTNHSLALRADGSLWAWGSNYYGQLGSTTNNGVTAANPTPTRVGTDFYTQATAGQDYSLGLRADGSLYAWGFNYSGQLGTGTSNSVANPTPLAIGPAGTWMQVVAGASQTLALRADGSLWGWGSNYYGQLGNGAPSTTANPTPAVAGTALPTRSTAMGSNFGLAVRADGTLWAWGDNTYGQLGDGTTTSRLKPRQIGTDHDWVLVAAGQYHSLALKANGSLWAWGLNNSGQLGNPAGYGTAGPNPLPLRVGTDSYTQIAASDYHSLALCPDGSLYAWGDNQDGALGNSTVTFSTTTPTRVGTDLYTQLAAGARHSLALRPDGSLWAWGENSNAQLGSAASNGIATPTRVGTTAYAKVLGGGFFSLGLRPDGSLYAWGQNTYGQLGTATNSGTITPTPTPTQVGTATYTQVAAGRFHVLALRPDGSLYAWGSNNYGQLGAGTISPITIPNPTPTQEVTASTAWASLAAGATGNLSLVRTASGLNFASAGRNDAGQLGDGTTIDWPRFDRMSPLSSLQSLPVLATGRPAHELRLAPNPAAGHATTTLRGATPGTTVQVLDALGRVVLTATADATGTAPLALPAGLAAGVYVVRSGAQGLRLAVE